MHPARGAFAKCASSLGSSQAPSPVDLISWVEKQGGKVNGIAVANLAGRDGGSGWGLKAAAAAGPGTKLLDLPSACHLTYTAADSEKLLKLIDRVPSELWGAKLALQVGDCILGFLAHGAYCMTLY